MTRAPWRGILRCASLQPTLARCGRRYLRSSRRSRPQGWGADPPPHSQRPRDCRRRGVAHLGAARPGVGVAQARIRLPASRLALPRSASRRRDGSFSPRSPRRLRQRHRQRAKAARDGRLSSWRLRGAPTVNSSTRRAGPPRRRTRAEALCAGVGGVRVGAKRSLRAGGDERLSHIRQHQTASQSGPAPPLAAAAVVA